MSALENKPLQFFVVSEEKPGDGPMYSLEANDDQPSDSIFGVNLSNPYEVATFLLTQMRPVPVVNGCMGHAHIPTSNAKNINHAIINWDKTIKILNEALRVASTQVADEVKPRALPQSYDYQTRIVMDDLQESLFFLNEKGCTFVARDRDHERSLPRQPMLKWIKSQNAVVQAPKISTGSMEEILRNIKEHAERARESKSNDNILGISK